MISRRQSATDSPRVPSWQEILDELRRRGGLDSQHTRLIELSGGVTSAVVGVARAGTSAPEYVIKVHPQPAGIAGEATYLRAYAGAALLPRLHDVDPLGRYLVYTYLPGTVRHRPPFAGNRATVLVELARQLFSHYRPADTLTEAGVGGWLAEPADPRLTWQYRFLQTGLRDEWLEGRLPADDLELVLELVRRSLEQTSSRPGYLLHGDCGPYNFVFRGRRLVGVIDAEPVLGEPLYDLASVFTAWPGDFRLEALLPAVEALTNWQPSSLRALVEQVLVVLYGQTVACLMFHPENVTRYLDAWRYWKGLLAST